MRYVQLAIPTDLQREICSILEEDNIEYAVTDDISKDDSVLVSFLLPVNAVEDVLNHLRETGLKENQFTVVMDTQAAASVDMASLEERYDDGVLTVSHISPPELREAAKKIEPDLPTYVALIIMGTIVAVVGLLTESVLLLAAAVIIAPYGDIPIASSVGAVIDDREMFAHSVSYQAIGVTLALATATASAFVFRMFLFIPPELDVSLLTHVDQYSRLSPFTLSVGVFSGVIGGLALATDRPTIISGIAISVALIPSAATVGIGLSWNEFSIAFSASVVLITGLVLINITGFLTLIAIGYSPSLAKSFRPDIGTTMKRSVYAVAIIILVLMVVTSGIFVYQNIQFEQSVKESADTVLSIQPFTEFRLMDLHVDYTGAFFDGDPAIVTVTVAVPSGVVYADLAGTLHAVISQNVDREVIVRVQIEEFQIVPEPDRANRRPERSVYSSPKYDGIGHFERTPALDRETIPAAAR